MGRSKSYINFKKHPDEMSDQELKAACPERRGFKVRAKIFTDSAILRGLIEVETKTIREGTKRRIRTMRGFWYDLIKPVLSRIGLLDSQTKTGKEKDWAALLSKYLTEAVKERWTSYKELNIIDGSRQRSVARTLVQQVVSVPVVGAHHPWVIIFTEKDTIWPIVDAVASLYGVSALSCGGEPSAACTEDLLRQILATSAYRSAMRQLVLIGLTDYDPHGYTIYRAQINQIKEVFPYDALPTYMKDMDAEHLLIERRIGLEPHQLTPEQRAKKGYEPKETGLAKWFKETDGVDGKPLGLELDAIPIEQVRKMFAEAIEFNIDLEARRNDLREAYVELLVWEELMPEIEERKESMVASVKASPVWAKIQSHPIPSKIFKNAAIGGDSSIDPMDVFDYDDEVKDVFGGEA